MVDPLEVAYKARLPLLEDLCSRLDTEVHELLSGVHHIDRICFRVKSPKSFTEKALDPENQPPYSVPLREVEDQVAGRVIVFFLSDMQPIVDRLRTTFTVVERTKRRPARDEEFGYESEHLICVIPPHVKPVSWNAHDEMPATIEIQVRTIFMHAYAEPQHDLGYKASHELSRQAKRELAWIAASSWGADQAFDRLFKRLETEER